MHTSRSEKSGGWETRVRRANQQAGSCLSVRARHS